MSKGTCEKNPTRTELDADANRNQVREYLATHPEESNQKEKSEVHEYFVKQHSFLSTNLHYTLKTSARYGEV